MFIVVWGQTSMYTLYFIHLPSAIFVKYCHSPWHPRILPGAKKASLECYSISFWLLTLYVIIQSINSIDCGLNFKSAKQFCWDVMTYTALWICSHLPDMGWCFHGFWNWHYFRSWTMDSSILYMDLLFEDYEIRSIILGGVLVWFIMLC